jgi:GNAT superfamily N-acetyltransferase
MRIDIRACTLEEIEQSELLPELLAAYGQESSIPELGPSSPCMATYRAMAASGVLHVIGAFAPGLVGVVTVLIYGLPHYDGRRTATLESFYVLPSARHGGTGLRLLHAAEALAAEQGAQALMVSAPAGGRLASVMERTAGYRETNRVFTRGLE